MLPELSERLVRVAVPDLPNHQFVIVAPTCKSRLVVRTPSETANFLSMSKKLLDGLGGANVSHKYCFVFAATSDKRVRPSRGTNPVKVATHCPNLLLLLYVPDLDLPIKGAH